MKAETIPKHEVQKLVDSLNYLRIIELGVENDRGTIMSIGVGIIMFVLGIIVGVLI